MSKGITRGRLATVVAFTVTTLVAIAAWWGLPRPVAVIGAPSEKVPCLSYAPYRDGQTPFDEGLIVPRQQIEEDLAILAKRTACVRTYSVDQGLDAVPEIAERLGLKVMLGAWIGRETAKNDRELARAMALANRYSGTIRAVIVGNEVLLRREQPVERLAALIAEVKANVPVPVTYADVWEFWLKHPEIAPVVDFITVHMLPYWEDQPIAVDDAVAHVLAIWDEVSAAFPGREIFIGETGWPSAGRMREGAQPGVVEQAAFVRGLLAAAAARGIDLNLIEAFDQPWKRKMEGTVGGHWGLFDAGREEKFPLTGAVEPVPHWPWLAAWSSLLSLIPLLAVLRWRPETGIGTAFVLATAAQLAGAALVIAAMQALDASVTVLDWLVVKLRLWLSIAAFGLVARALLLPPRPAALTSADVLTAMSRRQLPPWPSAAAFALGAVRLATLVAVAATTLALLFDPRYRDFPIAATMVAVAALLLLAWMRPSGAADAREDALLAVVLGVAGGTLIAREGTDNTQALAWAALCGMLALAVVLDRRHGSGGAVAYGGSRSARTSASTSAVDPAPAP